MNFIFFFFFNDTDPTEIYTVGNTLSLHDALPISETADDEPFRFSAAVVYLGNQPGRRSEEHTFELQSLPTISYAAFCLKKKKRGGDPGTGQAGRGLLSDRRHEKSG